MISTRSEGEPVAVSGKSRFLVIIRGTRRKRFCRAPLLIEGHRSRGHVRHFFFSLGCKCLWEARYKCNWTFSEVTKPSPSHPVKDMYVGAYVKQSDTSETTERVKY